MHFTGVDPAGKLTLPSLGFDELAELALGTELSARETEERRQVATRADPTAGVRPHVRDASDLAETGWAVVFPERIDPAIERALQPLLDRRREQAGRLFRCFSGSGDRDPGYRNGETKRGFLVARGAAPTGDADPERFPYYALLVGSPTRIPYEFERQLDVRYAVGRLDLPTPAHYGRYAEALTQYEKSPHVARRRFTTFGPAHEGDVATEHLSTDVAAHLASYVATRNLAEEVELVPPGAADWKSLRDLLGGGSTPDLLLTVGHGMELAPTHPDQRDLQGALVTQDWPGPRTPIAPKARVAAADIPTDADLTGLIAYFIACYGAGTPLCDSFAPGVSKRLARVPFTSALPQRMLGHPNAPALAVLSHVDRAWRGSYRWPGADQAETARVEDAVTRILQGERVGLAVEHVNVDASELSYELTALKARAEDGYGVDPQLVSRMFIAMHDARNLAVLGDPAARMHPATPRRTRAA